MACAQRKRYNNRVARRITQQGQVFLTLVFFIGGIVAVIGLLIAFFALSSADTGYGASAAFTAQSAATAGVEDALLELNRNAQFPQNSTMSNPYTVSTGSATATVTVTQNLPAAGEVTIVSVSTVLGHTKKIQVVVSEDPTTSQVSVVSWTQIQ